MTDITQPPAAEPDWAAIRARYEAGTEKVADIAASLNWAGIKLSRHAKAQGWALRGAGPTATKVKAPIAETTTKTLQRLKELLQKGTLPAGDYGAVVTGFVSLATALWSVHTNPTGKQIS